eukprot:CAMPEP_0180246432 /NCGR_PEP_ID=MMETSP0987-20121128/35562_1 /TAXON_ID=697907 /ORGANISM="non described non described, Strain CCMP2293" /LENGTH=100 /DNA_ID=CAMNT_0022214229 /DNA_START=25 /DNA_END=323 /DNA_ORIENTATION=+
MATFRLDSDKLRKQMREDRAMRSSVASARSSGGGRDVEKKDLPSSGGHMNSFEALMVTAAQRLQSDRGSGKQRASAGENGARPKTTAATAAQLQNWKEQA